MSGTLTGKLKALKSKGPIVVVIKPDVKKAGAKDEVNKTLPPPSVGEAFQDKSAEETLASNQKDSSTTSNEREANPFEDAEVVFASDSDDVVELQDNGDVIDVVPKAGTMGDCVLEERPDSVLSTAETVDSQQNSPGRKLDDSLGLNFEQECMKYGLSFEDPLGDCPLSSVTIEVVMSDNRGKVMSNILDDQMEEEENPVAVPSISPTASSMKVASKAQKEKPTPSETPSPPKLLKRMPPCNSVMSRGKIVVIGGRSNDLGNSKPSETANRRKGSDEREITLKKTGESSLSSAPALLSEQPLSPAIVDSSSKLLAESVNLGEKGTVNKGETIKKTEKSRVADPPGRDASSPKKVQSPRREIPASSPVSASEDAAAVPVPTVPGWLPINPVLAPKSVPRPPKMWKGSLRIPVRSRKYTRRKSRKTGSAAKEDGSGVTTVGDKRGGLVGEDDPLGVPDDVWGEDFIESSSPSKESKNEKLTSSVQKPRGEKRVRFLDPDFFKVPASVGSQADSASSSPSCTVVGGTSAPVKQKPQVPCPAPSSLSPVATPGASTSSRRLVTPGSPEKKAAQIPQTFMVMGGTLPSNQVGSSQLLPAMLVPGLSPGNGLRLVPLSALTADGAVVYPASTAGSAVPYSCRLQATVPVNSGGSLLVESMNGQRQVKAGDDSSASSSGRGGRKGKRSNTKNFSACEVMNPKVAIPRLKAQDTEQVGGGMPNQSEKAVKAGPIHSDEATKPVPTVPQTLPIGVNTPVAVLNPPQSVQAMVSFNVSIPGMGNFLFIPASQPVGVVQPGGLILQPSSSQLVNQMVSAQPVQNNVVFPAVSPVNVVPSETIRPEDSQQAKETGDVKRKERIVVNSAVSPAKVGPSKAVRPKESQQTGKVPRVSSNASVDAGISSLVKSLVSPNGPGLKTTNPKGQLLSSSVSPSSSVKVVIQPPLTMAEAKNLIAKGGQPKGLADRTSNSPLSSLVLYEVPANGSEGGGQKGSSEKQPVGYLVGGSALNVESLVYGSDEASTRVLKRKDTVARKWKGDEPELKGKRLRCGVCNLVFFNMDTMDEHSLIHARIFWHWCTLCWERFKHKNELKYHIHGHIGVTPPRSLLTKTCKLCGVEVLSRNFSAHLSVHQADRPYRCNHCNKSFRTKEHLKSHLSCHSDERPFECHVCGKRLKRKSALHSHLLLHTNQVPQFPCEQCGRAFPTASRLEMHKVTHSDERNFPCPICGKCFKTQAVMRAHERGHLMMLRLHCPCCSQVYQSRVGLRKHQKKFDHW